MVTRRLVVASLNQHKLRKLKAITAHLNLQVLGLPEMGDYPRCSNGETFQDNAKKKALEIAGLTGELVLADDSGLEVDALGGAPGVYSARFAGEPVSDGRNNELLLHKLAGLPLAERGAQFRCVIALAAPQGEVQFSEGICRGVILFEPRAAGVSAMILFSCQTGQTMAELQAGEKHDQPSLPACGAYSNRFAG